MNYAVKIIFVASLLFFTEGAVAQARFKAMAFAGVNLSQINGDKQEGYRQKGVSLGLNGSIFLRHDFDISTELLYNTRGARPDRNYLGQPNINYSTFKLHYSEVALLLNYHYHLSGSRNYYTQCLTAGVSYGRLLKSQTSIIRDNVPFTALENEVSSKLNPNDVSVIVGWSQYFTPKLGFALRHTGTVNFLYKNPEYIPNATDKGFEFLRPYYLSLHLFYNFVSPAKVMELKKKKKGTKHDPLEELY
ncbi:MAG: PorT family protein [Saprospiraceae bacterium]|nr:PorT family protein [Saprospiraceae bacterium]